MHASLRGKKFAYSSEELGSIYANWVIRLVNFVFGRRKSIFVCVQDLI